MALRSAARLLGITWVLSVVHGEEVFWLPPSVSSSEQGCFEDADLIASEDLSVSHSEGCTPVIFILEFCPLVTLVHIRGRPSVEFHLKANSSEWPSFQREASSGLEYTARLEGSSLSGTLVKQGAVWVCGELSDRIG